MKIKTGRWIYDFPADYLDCGCIYSQDPETHPEEPAYPLIVISQHDMAKMHENKGEDSPLRAMPTHISIVSGAAWFWPIPHKDTVARLRCHVVREI
jgi:hypothetical protein